MSRQFDVSVQNLIQHICAFMQKEGVESHYEAMHILNCAQDKLHEDYLITRSLQASAAGIKRIRDQEKDN